MLSSEQMRDSTQSPKPSVYQLFGTFFGPYRRDVLVTMFFYVFQNMYVWFSPILVGGLIDLAMTKNEERITWFFIYGGAALAMTLWNIPACVLRSKYQSKIARSMSRDLRVQICRQLQALTLLYHDRHSVGRIHSKAIRDIELLEQLPNFFIYQIFNTTVNICVAIGMISYRAPKALLAFAFLVPLSVFLNYQFRKPIKASIAGYRKSFENMSAGLTDMVTMIPVTRAHGLEEYEITRIEPKIREVFDKGRAFDSLLALFGSSSWVAFTLLQTVFLLGSVYFCFQGHLTTGDVVMFNAFFASISSSIQALVNMFPVLTQAGEAARSIHEILGFPDREANPGKRVVSSLRGEIRLESVSYTYPQAKRGALHQVSFEIAAGGRSVAFVGPSGCGKTTVLGLILGFIRPTEGRILIDGQDLREMDLRAYRRHIGVVSQEIVFFSGTILENVTYGMQDISRDRINEALDAANAWEFIEKLPEGPQTRLGEQGMKLSGGQRQRLAIARALIRDPRILILDEATSALDVESESLVQEALDRVMQNRTAIVVSHRLSTVRHCTKIIILERGRIQTEGSHEELLISDNFYSRILRSTSVKGLSGS